MEMVESLENRQEVQDGAITDLGAAVSRLCRGRRSCIMGRFYGIKILNNEISIDDVPILWKKVTQEWLSKNGTTSGLL